MNASSQRAHVLKGSRLRRRASLTLALGLVLLSSPWACWPGHPRAARPTAGTSVIAFGDSLVAGRGAASGRDFVSLLSQRLGVPIINAGHNGDTTGAALARLDEDVLSRDPRIAIVLLGGNDYLRRVPIDETFDNLTTIVKGIRERGAAVVLVGLSVGVFSDSYGDRYQSLAQQTAAALVPDILGGIFGHHDLMSDAIHPNEQGYEIIADRVEPVLRDLLSGD